MRFMKTKEPRLQAGFQLTPDEGVTADHAHKSAKRTVLEKRTGNPFAASHATMSLAGKASTSRPTCGKSNSELEPLVRDFRKTRKRAGFEELKMFCGDGGQDRNVWKKAFPEPEAGIEPHAPTQDGCTVLVGGLQSSKGERTMTCC
jgi:hypothetical protein